MILNVPPIEIKRTYFQINFSFNNREIQGIRMAWNMSEHARTCKTKAEYFNTSGVQLAAKKSKDKIFCGKRKIGREHNVIKKTKIT